MHTAFLSFPWLVAYTGFCYDKVCKVALSVTTDVICQQRKKMRLSPICSVIATEEQQTEAFAQWGGREVVMRQVSGFRSEQCKYHVGGVAAGWKAEASWNFVSASLSLTLQHCVYTSARDQIFWGYSCPPGKETLKVASGIMSCFCGELLF